MSRHSACLCCFCYSPAVKNREARAEVVCISWPAWHASLPHERLESAFTGALRVSRCCGHTSVVVHSKSSLCFPVHSSLQSPRLAQQNFEASFLESRCWPPWLVRSWIISFILRLSPTRLICRPSFIANEGPPTVAVTFELSILSIFVNFFALSLLSTVLRVVCLSTLSTQFSRCLLRRLGSTFMAR